MALQSDGKDKFPASGTHLPELLQRSSTSSPAEGNHPGEHVDAKPGQSDGAYGGGVVKHEAVKQGLSQRHLQLMSLAGSIGECNSRGRSDAIDRPALIRRDRLRLVQAPACSCPLDML